jgi:hypothetical protein
MNSFQKTVEWDAEAFDEHQAKVTELVAAAMAFDALMQSHYEDQSDSKPVFGINTATITVGDLRRLRKALLGMEGGK